jgi:hypothetical protein
MMFSADQRSIYAAHYTGMSTEASVTKAVSQAYIQDPLYQIIMRLITKTPLLEKKPLALSYTHKFIPLCGQKRAI